MTSIIKLNGKTYRGNSIQISGNKVIIDGVVQDTDEKEKIINISVEGDIQNLEVDYAKDIKITGNVRTVQTSSGDVVIGGSVENNIQTSSGDVEVDGAVGGGIQTSSGDVKCGAVAGNVKTNSGNIRHKSVKA